MLKNKDISELLVSNFSLSLDVATPDKFYRKHIGEETWEELRNKSIRHTHGICQGCGYMPPDKEFLELHVVSGEAQNEESYKFALLCKTCHTLQHIDIAGDKGWIKLVNSIFDQKKLISICRSGNSNLLSKLRSGEIMTLDTDPKKYSKDIVDNIFNKRKKMKAIFGKDFPQERLK